MTRKLSILLTLILVPTLGYLVVGPGRLPDGLAEAGAPYDVEILRDTWGVPHIFGRTDADAAYGLAYAHAEDDFETIQNTLLAARGRLASVHGREAAPNDYLVHLMRVWDVVEAGYEGLSPEARAICEAYAAGLNHYAALHPGDAITELYPVRGQDVVAGFVHKTPFFFGLDRTLRVLFSDEGPEAAPTAAFLQPPSAPATGSNAFAVAPRRTADSSTFLAVNSHQPWTGPVAWYEAHLHSEEGWDMVGGTFPGAPVILHGHNRHLGWAHTVNSPDLVDVYTLEIDPDDPNRYRLDGAWKTLEVRTAPITVKLWGPFHWTTEREVLWSDFGPVVRRPHGTYALRVAGYGEVRHIEQWYRMNKAADFEAWQEAMRINALPMFNVVYADGEGNIHYHYNGRLPLRAEGYEWQDYLPGNTTRVLWTDYLPYDVLPHVTNPASGFVQNCNSSPFRTTQGAGNPSPGAYSYTLGIETTLTNRALRALALFGGDESITLEEFYAYKFDMAYAPNSRVGALVRQLLTAPPPSDEPTRQALEHLRGWDLQTDPDNRHAALPLLALEPLISNTDAVTDDFLMDRLRDAARRLRDHYGGLDVPWETVNRLRHGDVDLGLGGGPDVLHAVYGDLGKDGRYVGRAGDSYVLMVAWDAEGRVHSRSIHPFGSATLDADSPHYADQAPLFATRRLKPVWMDEADIRANLERAYRPGETP